MEKVYEMLEKYEYYLNSRYGSIGYGIQKPSRFFNV
jgi:hypothetical protein